MAESTLRRHLATLVKVGLIRRQDSPNGKRYRRRGAGQDQAFGFDLRPLLVRADEIARASAEVVEATEALKRRREALVLHLRDAAKLLAYGREAGLPGNWDGLDARLIPLRAALRRKMQEPVIARCLAEVGTILRALTAMLEVPTENMNATVAQNGRHQQNSNKDSSESEPSESQEGREAQASRAPGEAGPVVPLALVFKACPDILPYSRDGLRSWRDLVATAGEVRGMKGISSSAWNEAQQFMGPETAAMAVSAILQRFDRITSPGGYLRALSGKAAAGGFSPGPMIMALLRAS